MAGVTSVVIDGTTYLLDDIHAVDFSEEQGLNETQKQQGRSNIGAASGADVTAAQEDIDDLQTGAELLGINAMLLHGEIPNTTQTIEFDSLGNVSTITHTNGSNVDVRTDAFTFSANSITEVRTLNTGETLTVVTNTTTLVTTVTYAAEA